jgi:hypothetical protein
MESGSNDELGAMELSGGLATNKAPVAGERVGKNEGKIMGYDTAEKVLSALACGQPVAPTLASVAAVELECVALAAGSSTELWDAYRSLHQLAAGAEPTFGLCARRRTAQLADMLRVAQREREQLQRLAMPPTRGAV